MIALTVSDWTSLAVAVGTLLLAVATFTATVIARHSTREAYRSRIDASAPRLVVLDLKVQQGVEKPETVTAGNFGFANAGAPIDVEDLGDEKLGVFVDVEIANHGTSSGYVDLALPPDVFVKTITLHDTTPYSHNRFYSNHVVLLQPLGKVTVKLVWRQSATAWSQEPDFPNRLPTRHVEIRIKDTLGSVIDTGTISFGGYALMRTPSKPGTWCAAPRSLFQLIPQGGSNTLEEIGQIDRTYPKERAWKVQEV
jgi:hypothetical protein